MSEEEKPNLWIDVNIGLNSNSSESEILISKPNSEELYDKLQTGDMILCHGYNPKSLDPGLDGLIEFATHSPWENML